MVSLTKIYHHLQNWLKSQDSHCCLTPQFEIMCCYYYIFLKLLECFEVRLNTCQSSLQEKGFKEREAALMAKNAELEESLISFSKYLQENDAKKARANKRAIDEAHACEEKSQEAEDLVRHDGGYILPHNASLTAWYLALISKSPINIMNQHCGSKTLDSQNEAYYIRPAGAQDCFHWQRRCLERGRRM